ncbi:unnamed protein product [Prunus brigantina]
MRYPFETLTVSKLKSEHTYALVTSRGSHWDKNAPQLQCPRATTRRQRVGVQSDNPSPENLGISGQDSYPSLKIYEILPNHQLDHAERINFHTLIAKNGGRMTENEAGEVSVKTGAFLCVFRRNHGGWRRDPTGEGRGRRPGHFGTGPVEFGGRMSERPAKIPLHVYGLISPRSTQRHSWNSQIPFG